MVASPKNYAIALLAVATLGAAWVAWRQHGELRELRTAALNRDERADLQKRLWELEKLNRDLRARLAAQDETPPEPGAAPDDGRPPGERGGRGEPRRDQMKPFTARERALRELMLKPEVQAMLNQQQQPALDARYAALFRQLNLPADQLERLKTLLAERSMTVMDVLSAARDQGADPRQNPDAFRKLIGDAQAAIDDSIRAAIGDAAFAQLGTYEQTLPQRNVVNQLEQRLSYTSTPLTSAQAEQLVQILAANPSPTAATNSALSADRPPPRPDGPPPGRGPDPGMILHMLGSGGAPPLPVLDGGRGTTSAPVTPAAVAQSQTVLAPPQVQALQQIQQQQQSQQQLRQMVIDTLGANPPARGNPPPPKRPGG